MKIWMALAVAALSAAGGAKDPRSLDYTPKTTTDLAGCIALQLTETKGYEVLKEPRADGLDLKMRFRVVGVGATAATFRIDDLGDRRRLTIFATGKASGAPRVIAEKARSACV